MWLEAATPVRMRAEAQAGAPAPRRTRLPWVPSRDRGSPCSLAQRDRPVVIKNDTATPVAADFLNLAPISVLLAGWKSTGKLLTAAAQTPRGTRVHVYQGLI